MELKIGEIKQINGEWYQCVEGNGCENCAFEGRKCYLYNDTDDPIGECCYDRRRDNRDVIFKKLEKLGEPFERNGYMYQEYKAYTFPLLMSGGAKIPTPNGFAVIIKQNKEDMDKVIMNIDDRDYLLDRLEAILHDTHCQQYKDEICEAFSKYIVSKTNLKPFNLEEAKAGKPVCTRNGRKARIICFDKIGVYPIIALVQKGGIELCHFYTEDGKCVEETNNDLMMLLEKKEGWVNVYYDNDTSSHRGCRFIYDTKEQAIRSSGEGYITTIKIEWEE